MTLLALTDRFVELFGHERGSGSECERQREQTRSDALAFTHLGCEFTLDTLPARKAVVSLRAPNLSATSILVEHGEYGWWHALVNADTPIINIGDYEFVSEDLARLRTWLAGFEAEHADWHMP